AAVVFTYAAMALMIAAGVRVARQQAVTFLDELPATIAAVKRAALRPKADAPPPQPADAIHDVQRAATNLGATRETAAPLGRRVPRVVVHEPFDLRDYLLDAWTQFVGLSARLLVIGLLTFVLLLSGDRIKSKLVEIAGPRFDRQIVTLDVIGAIDRQIQRYLIARAAISAIVMAATALAMWGLGVREPLVLGAIAGVFNVLPFVGPAVAIAVCAVVAFVQFHAVQPALFAGGAATLVAALEGNLITPLLTSHAGELNAVAVYVSVLFWGWMWGVGGLLLAVPIMIWIKAAADHIEPLQPFGELLGR